MERVRICTLQYYIRPVRTFQDFAEQVASLVETASDYGCRLVVFPEYYAVQLLTLGDIRAPMRDQIRKLAAMEEQIVELMTNLARKHHIYVVAGSIPTLCPQESGVVHNDCYVFSPTGAHGIQGKMHMTRFEKEEWIVSPRDQLMVFDTDFGRLAVTICYDVEFPEIARVCGHMGCHILVVPSCTDDRQGFLRVRYCAQARAIENQMYVVCSHTVGSLPMVPAVHLNYGQAAILTPSDFQFSRDGVLAEGLTNTETAVIGELNMDTIESSRTWGSVLPLNDSKRTKQLILDPEVVNL